MNAQLQLWDDKLKVDAAASNPPAFQQPDDSPQEMDELGKELKQTFLNYLVETGNRIATSECSSASERRDEFIRHTNLLVAIGKIDSDQRILLQRLASPIQEVSGIEASDVTN